ncbi:MAG: MopE-related protein [Polyangiales bacterium]
MSALVLAAFLGGCGGGIAVVGGDAGDALALRDGAADVTSRIDAADVPAAADAADVLDATDAVSPPDDRAVADVTDVTDVTDVPKEVRDRAEPMDLPAEPDVLAPPDVNRLDSVANPACPSRCLGGETCCLDGCVDLQTSARNCGLCERRCEVTQTCVQGQCAPICPPGQARCGLDCVDLQSSQRHCGACENLCPVGFVCAAGACTQACPTGTRNCNGVCVDPASDEGNCGDCGMRCGPDITCFQGRCQTQCGSTSPTYCPGLNYCANIRTDATDCGRCGNACPAGMRCAAGACVCPAGQILCGSACVSAACALGVGACRRDGATRCVSGAPQCDAVPGSPGVEVCDNIDNNCNGMVDEMLVRSCYSGAGMPGVGICAAGTQQCTNGAWGVCSGVTGPRTETCNGQDDDCDNTVDNVPTQACFTGGSANRGRGLCRDGQLQCVGGAARCLGEQLPLPEICNNQDDDCDGATDEEPLPSSCPAHPNAVLTGCSAGQCAYACQPGFANCDGNMLANGCEVNLRSDPNRCGSCGNACPTGNVCNNGACASVCTGVFCSGQCVDTATSMAHCGACGNACVPPTGGTAVCMAGTCVGGCPAGTTRCGNLCVDLTRDPGNCGACGVTCGTGRVCQNDTGTPACVCGNGALECGGVCVNPTGDVNNCGGCGLRCGAGQTCAQGVCRCAITGTSLCNGACVTLGTPCESGIGACRRSGLLVCGTGGTFCNAVPGTPTTERCNNVDDDCDGVADNNNAAQTCTTLPFQTAVCASGACAIQCLLGRGDCDGMLSNGCETDLLDDPLHCGRCGGSCGNGQCLAGACVPCGTGLSRCGNACVNLSTDAMNCGACGTRCGLGEYCEAGACRLISVLDGGVRLDGGLRD